MEITGPTYLAISKIFENIDTEFNKIHIVQIIDIKKCKDILKTIISDGITSIQCYFINKENEYPLLYSFINVSRFTILNSANSKILFSFDRLIPIIYNKDWGILGDPHNFHEIKTFLPFIQPQQIYFPGQYKTTYIPKFRPEIPFIKLTEIQSVLTSKYTETPVKLICRIIWTKFKNTSNEDQLPIFLICGVDSLFNNIIIECSPDTIRNLIGNLSPKKIYYFEKLSLSKCNYNQSSTLFYTFDSISNILLTDDFSEIPNFIKLNNILKLINIGKMQTKYFNILGIISRVTSPSSIDSKFGKLNRKSLFLKDASLLEEINASKNVNEVELGLFKEYADEQHYVGDVLYIENAMINNYNGRVSLKLCSNSFIYSNPDCEEAKRLKSLIEIKENSNIVKRETIFLKRPNNLTTLFTEELDYNLLGQIDLKIVGTLHKIPKSAGFISNNGLSFLFCSVFKSFECRFNIHKSNSFVEKILKSENEDQIFHFDAEIHCKMTKKLGNDILEIFDIYPISDIDYCKILLQKFITQKSI